MRRRNRNLLEAILALEMRPLVRAALSWRLILLRSWRCGVCGKAYLDAADAMQCFYRHENQRILEQGDTGVLE